MSDNITGAVIGLATDAGIALILYYFYKRGRKTVDQIQKTKVYGIDKELIKTLKDLPDHTIAYGCVEGITGATNTLTSHYQNDTKGVIRNIALVEHKSKRSNGVWTDVQNVIRDAVDVVPFYLQAVLSGFTNDNKVHIQEPKSASFLMDDLTTTYDSYQANQSKDLLQRGLDRLFGDVSKGLHEYERMLLIGTPLLGIGQIKLDNNKVQLQPPDNGSRYILTTRSREEIIKHYSSQSTVIKVFLGIASVIGIGLAIYIARKLYKNYKVRRMFENMAAEARRARQAARAAARDTTPNNETPECVICLTNPREVILLNCGHICLCIDCVEALPRPMQCPVCRQHVHNYTNAYIA